MTADDLAALSFRELRQKLQSIQVRAFALFDDAARQAEDHPEQADAAYLRAQQLAKPLLQQGDALREELVRRARRRARNAWRVVWVALFALLLVVGWQLAR